MKVLFRKKNNPIPREVDLAFLEFFREFLDGDDRYYSNLDIYCKFFGPDED